MLLPMFLLLPALAALALTWLVLRVFCRSAWDFPFVFANISLALLHAVVSLLSRRGKPRFPEWTATLEIMQTVSHRVMTKYGANMALQTNAQRFRQLSDMAGSVEGYFSCKDHNTTLHPVTLNRMEHLWIRSKEKTTPTPQDANANPDKYVVLYLHGGGYTIFSPRFYIALCNRLRQSILQAVNTTTNTNTNTRPIQVDVFLANYGKAPEATYPVPQQDALLAYEYLRDHEGITPDRLIIAGDSAGAGLVLSTLLRLRDDRAVAQPLAAILSFPLADFGEDTDPQRGQHCIISKAFVRTSFTAMLSTDGGNDPVTWKDASAVYCDLRGLAPALLQVGTADYLYQDSLKLFAKAQQDGVTDWELDVYANMPHTFSTLPPEIVPDSARAVTRMGEFIAKRIAISQQ